MKKRDIKIYDKSWDNVSKYITEYDVDIIANMIDPNEWKQIVALEKEFDKRYPMLKFNYNLVETKHNVNQQSSNLQARLIYDAETQIDTK